MVRDLGMTFATAFRVYYEPGYVYDYIMGYWVMGTISVIHT